MARTYVPKVNGHVTYFATTTAKAKPGTITAVGSTNGGIRLRFGRNGGTVGTASVGILRVPFVVDGTHTRANTYVPY